MLPGETWRVDPADLAELRRPGAPAPAPDVPGRTGLKRWASTWSSWGQTHRRTRWPKRWSTYLGPTGGAGDRPGPLAVGIVSTVSGASRSVQRSIAEVRRSSPDVPVLLGGAAIPGAAQARRLGADVYTGKWGDELARAVETIADERF
jgi:hypothetical protein